MKILFQGDSITDASRDRSDIHNLGRGYEAVSGAAVTADVLGNGGMKANINGMADPVELARYQQILAAEDAQAAVETEAQASENAAEEEFVGPAPATQAQ